MSLWLLALISVVFLLFLIAIGMPVAFAMALTGITGLVYLQGTGALDYAVGQFPVSRIMTYPLSVLPLFILMGQCAFAAGIAEDAYDTAHVWLRPLRGGLCMVTIGACGLFAATTGSSAAEVSAMGKIAIPEMRRFDYDKRLALGTVAAAGTIGTLIPPSMALVLYGILTYEPIGDLFIAGILPGIPSLLIYMGMVYARCLKNPKLAPRAEMTIGWKERMSSLVKSWGTLLILATILGGIYTGIATPTEVGAVGCFVAFLLVFNAMRNGRSNWNKLREAIIEAIKLNAVIFAFLFGSGIFSLFITATNVLPQMVELIQGSELSRYWILAAIYFAYIPLGMFLDPISITIVTLPLVYPIITVLGFNGIWFGIVFTKLMEIAVITPPMGMNLFVLKAQFPDIELADVIRGTFWFVAMDILTLVILTIFPGITLWLPGTTG